MKSKLGRPARSYNNRIQTNKLAVNWIISSRIRCNNRSFVNLGLPKITGKSHISYATIKLPRLTPLHGQSLANLRGQYGMTSFLTSYAGIGWIHGLFDSTDLFVWDVRILFFTYPLASLRNRNRKAHAVVRNCPYTRAPVSRSTECLSLPVMPGSSPDHRYARRVDRQIYV